MQELKNWINSSAENKLHFQRRLEQWSAAVDVEQSHYFNKEAAYKLFKERVNRATELMIASDPSLNRFHLRSSRKRIYYSLAGYAALLLIMIAAAYFFKKESLITDSKYKNGAQISYIEIKVPAGSIEHLTLPDKSVVWLNAGSTFKYPADFSGKTRAVYLNGEGYFQVAKDTVHPFIVNTSKGDITVTGTVFNVYAYDAKLRFETALLEGHVYVNTPGGPVINLLPSQKAELSGGSLVVSSISNPDQYRWMEGLICFDNEPITEVLENLQNAFGHTIIIKHLAEPDLLLTGKFRIDDGLAYALKVLRDSYGIKYREDKVNKTYIILN